MKGVRENLFSAFTLIELLVVISIIGILISLSLFGIQNSRKSARDAKRKSDLEAIRSALEMYKADKGEYPSIANANNRADVKYLPITDYIDPIPIDPVSDRYYVYTCTEIVVESGKCVKYALCSSLETQQDSSSVSCGRTGTNCYNTGCHYKVTSP